MIVLELKMDLAALAQSSLFGKSVPDCAITDPSSVEIVHTNRSFLVLNTLRNRLIASVIAHLQYSCRLKRENRK